MKLVRADGHQQQQWALANPHTQTIARILSEHIDDDENLLPTVARILRNLHGEAYDRLDQELTTVRDLYELISSEKTIPDYVIELLQSIHELYHHPRFVLYPNLKDQVNSLRGAVVELLGLELIKARYIQSDECANSRRFVNQHRTLITLQEVDVAALSQTRRQLEGYECKMKVHSLADHDRVDLEYLYRVAEAENYRAQVGVISLDPTKLAKRRLGLFNADACVQAYGVDLLDELLYSPFEREISLLWPTHCPLDWLSTSNQELSIIEVG